MQDLYQMSKIFLLNSSENVQTYKLMKCDILKTGNQKEFFIYTDTDKFLSFDKRWPHQ